MMGKRNRIICLISVFLLFMLAGCSAVSGEYAAGGETGKDSDDRIAAPENMEAQDMRLPENEDETVVSADLEHFLMENGKTVWLWPGNFSDISVGMKMASS